MSLNRYVIQPALSIAILALWFIAAPVQAQASDLDVPGIAPSLSGVLGTLCVILGLSFMVESVVEAMIGRIVDHVPVLAPWKWATIYAAVAVGVIGAFTYQFDLVYLLAQYVAVPVAITWYGIAITGVAIGMGAGYIHQIISKYFPARKPEVTELDEHNIRSYG